MTSTKAVSQVALILSCLSLATNAAAQGSLPEQRHFDAATGILVEPCVTLDGAYARGRFQLETIDPDGFQLSLISAELIDPPTMESAQLGSACSEVSRDEFSSLLIYNFLDILMTNSLDEELANYDRRFELYTVSSLDEFRFAINSAVENQLMDVVVIKDKDPVVVAGPNLNSLPFEAEPGEPLAASYRFNYAGTASYDGLSNSLSIQFDEQNETGNYALTLRLVDPAGSLIDGGATYPIEFTAVEDSEIEGLPDMPPNFPPSFSAPSSLSVVEDSGAQSLPGWVTAISPGPASEATQTVSLSLTVTSNAALFSVQPVITDAGDLSFTVAPDAFGAATLALRATDSDGESSAVHIVTLTATSVNDPPTFTVPASVSTTEDSGAQALSNWVTGINTGPANEAQTMAFTVSNDNNALFAVQPAIDSDGRLTYTPQADANGSAALTIEGSDGIDSHTPAAVTLTVTAVNDKPGFSMPATLTLDEDAGAQTENPWATAILAGPADESAQTVSFNVSNDNNGLFAVQPAVDAAGILTFTPADDAFGTATVSVTAEDSAGETSPTQQLALTINSVNDPPVFTSGGTITVAEDNGGDGSNTLGNWATDVSAGPANEGQTIAFTVTNDNNGLFSTQPAIDATGELTFTTVANASGSAELTITASDGVATTAIVNETLTVTAVNDAPVATSHLSVASRAIEVIEDGFYIIHITASDIEDDDFRFALSSAAANGTFYFPKNTANVANRVSSLTFDISGTTDPVAELFDAIAPSDSSFTNFSGTSATFMSGFVIAYLPDPDQVIAEEFSLRFSDVHGANSVAVDFTLTPYAINDAPLISHVSGNVLAGDTATQIVFGDESLTDPFVATPLDLTYEIGDDRNLGFRMLDVDAEALGADDALYVGTMTSTLPAECTVSYTQGGIVRDHAATPLTDEILSYADLQVLVQTITASCPTDGTTGTVSIKISDSAFTGDCFRPHPRPGLGEVGLDGQRCVRVSKGVLNLQFSDPL